MTRSLAAALALAVLLAGCNAPVDSTPGSTLSPAPVPEKPASHDRPSGELAPGVGPTGVTDAARLASAHAETLAGAGYTVNQTLSQTYTNGTVESRYVTHARFAPDAARFTTNLTQTDRFGGDGLSTRHIERFADGERVYEVVTERTTARYRVIRGPEGVPRPPSAFYPSNFTNERAIARLFTLVETTTTDRWTEDGTRYVRVASPREAPFPSLPPLQNVTLVATVTGSGLVTDYRVEYDVIRSGDVVHVVVAVEYTAVGETTVHRPDWVDRVPGGNATG